jgi:hypothetical protein
MSVLSIVALKAKINADVKYNNNQEITGAILNGDLIDMIMRNTGNARRSRAEAVRAGRAVEGSFKKGGSVKSSASKRGDGCAVRGKTKGRMV